MMDVIIRNDLFISYTGLIDRVMRANRRMLCTLPMEPDDIYQELALVVLHALDDYEEQRATTMDAHVWMKLQCALAELKQSHGSCRYVSGPTAQKRNCGKPASKGAIGLSDLVTNDRLWQALSRLDPAERECVIQYLNDHDSPAARSRHCLDSAMEKLKTFYLSIHVVSL